MTVVTSEIGAHQIFGDTTSFFGEAAFRLENVLDQPLQRFDLNQHHFQIAILNPQAAPSGPKERRRSLDR